MHFWFPRILPVVLLAQVGGGVFRLAAQFIAIGFVLQLLFETLYREEIVPLFAGQYVPGKQGAHQQ